jgi:gluconolactonase
VFRVAADGSVELLDNSLARPNGIAFSPDESTLYVANSDPDNAIWMAYEVTDAGGIENGRVLFDATDKVPEAPGLPDGLKVDATGIIDATGPGGVLVFNSEGEHLGTVNTGAATANVALDADQDTLYMTAHKQLMRVSLTGSR